MNGAVNMANPIASRRLSKLRRVHVLTQGLAACAVLAVLTYTGFVLDFILTTIGLLYLLGVMATALYGGFWQASLTSLIAACCLDYFVTQPIQHFYMTDPKEWVALAAFQITAVVISRLSAKELRSARDAAIHRVGMEQLYELSRSSLSVDLHQAPGSQLVVLIQRSFDADSVALFDANLGRQDKAGEWGEIGENLARETFLTGAATDDPRTETWRRILLAGPRPVGALVVCGKLCPLVVDALASLADSVDGCLRRLPLQRTADPSVAPVHIQMLDGANDCRGSVGSAGR